MISILPSTAWREFRGEAKHKGLNKTTHQAMIEDPTGKLHRCYVKGCPANWPTPLTEAFGWLLSEALNLPRPEFAALVLVPLDKLRSHMHMDQHWLNYSEMLSFCASTVYGATSPPAWRWLAHMRTKRVYKRPEVARISAFDYWVDNQDRNNSNLIVKRDGDCVPIDNEFILYSVLWNGKVNFQVAPKSLFVEAKRFLGGNDYARFTVEVARQAKLHDAAFAMAEFKLKETVNLLIPDATAAKNVWNSVEQFLSPRGKPDWLSNQLGVIV